MLRFNLLLLILLSFAQNGHAQTKSAPKTEKVFLNKGDTTKNAYFVLYPPKTPWKGFVILVPGFGETPENVLEQTSLPDQLASSGFLTVIPTLQDGVLSFGVDQRSQEALSGILQDAVSRYKLAGLRLFLGGFSIGASCVIKYAENSVLRPAAVFAVDPPLDFERFYYSAKRDLRLPKDQPANQENTYMIKRLEKETGGTPTTHPAAYRDLSPYSFSDTTQQAVKKLTNTPLRIYTEPDIDWWMKERRADFTALNATECSALINELNRLGNDKARLIVTQNKGYRQPGHRRHPHSWSIVDNDELIRWLLAQK